VNSTSPFQARTDLGNTVFLQAPQPTVCPTPKGFREIDISEAGATTTKLRWGPCKGNHCPSCGTAQAIRHRKDIAACLVGAMAAGAFVTSVVLTVPTLRDYSASRRSVGRLIEDLKCHAGVAGAVTVTHAHRSGRAHFHLAIVGRRHLPRRTLTPYVGKHGFGLRGGFHVEEIRCTNRASELARYLTKPFVGTKRRLEHVYGTIRRANLVTIPQSVRRFANLRIRNRRTVPSRRVFVPVGVDPTRAVGRRVVALFGAGVIQVRLLDALVRAFTSLETTYEAFDAC
jgi:hypothetical protein